MTIYDASELCATKKQVDLNGPDGNAFVLLAMAKDMANQLDMDFAPIQDEMTSGDYENLVQVFDREFGKLVDIYR